MAQLEPPLQEVERDQASDKRLSLLFLCQTLPYPPDGGVNIRTYNVLRLLSRRFAITGLCFYRAVDRATAQAVRRSVEGLKPFADVQAFPIPQEHSRPRLVMDHLRSVFTRRAYTVPAYDSSAFRARLLELLDARQFDIAHVDSLDLATYLPLLDGMPVVCVHHNVESSLLERRAATSALPIRGYLSLQARLTRREEAYWCPRVSLNVVVSQADARELRSIAPSAHTTVVPNGVDTSWFVPGNADESGIVFVGAHSWQPNRGAMEWFSTKVLPLVRASGTTRKLTWVGRAPDVVRDDFATRGVELTGYVDDIRPYVQRAAVYVAPLLAGGGTRLKILDAWAMGKAVVSTSVGCEGLNAQDGDNILIRDTPADFASAVSSVLSDSQLRTRLGRSARATAEQLYDWEKIGNDMIPQYESVMRK